MKALDVINEDRHWSVECEDALKWLASLPSSFVDLILTDPPYYRVKSEPWDRAWDKPEGFLAWIGRLCEEWRRVLRPNGSLYVFASAEMGCRVEGVVARFFNVLNFITWRKPPFSTKAEMFDKDTMRAFFPASERVIFADHYGSDEAAMGEAGWESQCEAAKRQVFGGYLRSEFERAGVTNKQVAALFPSRTGGLTGCVSNWILGANAPTPEQYKAMREYLNAQGGDYLHKEYEDLRREYEDLRRPFFATPDAPYTDVWDFATVGDYPGKHPCEKPLDLLRHMIRVSSRPGAVVLDCFTGSGNVGKAALSLDRRFVGCDNAPKWAQFARERIGCRQLHIFEEAA